MRWTWLPCETSEADADGEVVWSWRRGAGAMWWCGYAPLHTGAKKPFPGEITKQPLKPAAQGRPGCIGHACGSCPVHFVRTGAMGGGQAPGLPCALCDTGGQSIAKLGRRPRRREGFAMFSRCLISERPLASRSADALSGRCACRRDGADGGTRTHTTLPSRDFKSLASTDSATSAFEIRDLARHSRKGNEAINRFSAHPMLKPARLPR
jgi:hypothetical protein